MLGIKIFDTDSEADLNNIFNLVNKENLAIEIALYNHNQESFMSLVIDNPKYQQIKEKSIHLDYRKYLVNNLQESKYYHAFEEELLLAKKLGLSKGVIHYQTPKNYQIHLEQFKKDNIIKNLTILYNKAKEDNFVFHIENTFIYKHDHPINNLVSHRLLWDTILDLNYQDYLGICLDWGHVKAFTKDSLSEWLEFVRYLKSNKMPIYMHVHDNNSFKDQHLSLKQSVELNLAQYNHVKDLDFIEYLVRINEEFKDDVLILEYSSDIAIEHYLWTKQYLENYVQQ